MPSWDKAQVQATAKQLRLASDPRRIRHGHGLRMGQGPGSSLEFHDYRNYVMGDDLRMIDWGVYARSDQLVLRRHRQEISPRVEILLDASASMGIDERKWSLAAGISALLMSLTQNDGARASLWLCGEQLRLAQKVHWSNDLEMLQASGQFGLRHAMHDLQPGSERFIISDGLYAEGGRDLIKRLGVGAGRICLIQILTHEEREPDAWGNVRIIDVEGGERHLIIDDAACSAYKQRLARLQAGWQEALSGRGAGLIQCDAEQDLQQASKVLLREGIVVPGAGA